MAAKVVRPLRRRRIDLFRRRARKIYAQFFLNIKYRKEALFASQSKSQIQLTCKPSWKAEKRFLKKAVTCEVISVNARQKKRTRWTGLMHEGFLREWCRLTFVIPSGFFPDRSANFIFVFFVQPLSKTIIIISPYFFSFLFYTTAGDGPPGHHRHESCCGSVGGGGSDGPPVQLGFDCRRSCPLSQGDVAWRVEMVVRHPLHVPQN